MELKLKVLVGSNSGQEIKIPGPKFFIGRAEDCHLRPRSDLISRHHCVLILEDRFVSVRDFGSKNGTYVNGERVGAERELRNGDQLKAGPLEFEVAITETAVAKKRPKVTSVAEAAARTANSEFEIDVGISTWLTDSTASPAAESDTREIRHPDTAEVSLKGSTTKIISAAELMGVAEKAETPAEGEDKKEAGKLPPQPHQNQKDSFSAAAEMLKKLRKR